MLLFVRAGTPRGSKVKLAKPRPPQVRNITHHSIELHWEESLDAANTYVDSESGDSRTQVIVEQLSPGFAEEWQLAYKYDYY